jgi:hypothetical protein
LGGVRPSDVLSVVCWVVSGYGDSFSIGTIPRGDKVA